jgi:GMP synthase-like glutamine amidotransferase
VTVVPEHSFKIGESSKCNIETLISKDKRIFSFQFHPEYTEEYIHAYESRLNGEEPKLSKKHDDFHHKSIEIIRKTMRSFLDWTI